VFALAVFALSVNDACAATASITLDVYPATTENLCHQMVTDLPDYISDGGSVPKAPKSCTCGTVSVDTSQRLRCRIVAEIPDETPLITLIVSPKSMAGGQGAHSLRIFVPRDKDRLTSPPPVTAILNAPMIRIGKTPSFNANPQGDSKADLSTLFGLHAAAWQLQSESKNRPTSARDAAAVYWYLLYSKWIFFQTGLLINDDKSTLIEWMNQNRSAMQTAIGSSSNLDQRWGEELANFFLRYHVWRELAWSYAFNMRIGFSKPAACAWTGSFASAVSDRFDSMTKETLLKASTAASVKLNDLKVLDQRCGNNDFAGALP